ncbi:MAG: putative Ig domain-containing protein [Acidobacteriota bacterium]|nr:MAG: putative Ig domain-containing protein [Acidobacteriota bacterium]
MKTKLICVLVAVLTAFVFGANYFSARAGCPQSDCVKCNCTVKLKHPDTAEGKEPSCSVIFTIPAPRGGNFYQVVKLSRATKSEGSFQECDAAVVCDKNSQMELTCANRMGGERKDYKTTIFPESKCSVGCRRIEDDKFPAIFGWKPIPGARVTFTNCEHWERTPSKKGGSNKTVRPPGGGFGSFFAGSNRRSALGIPSFLPTRFSGPESEEDEPGDTISDKAWWKTIEGEAGTDQGILTVPEGEVVVRSFCTGEESRVSGPGTITLPVCKNELEGRWRGAYARRHPDGKLTHVAVNVELRKEGRFLGGDVTTPEGVYRINSVNQQSSSVEIKAAGLIGGKQKEIVLYGQPGKGEIAFDGREGTPGQVSVRIVGLVRRLYIADDAVPPAVAGQPYEFTMLAFSPENTPVHYSLDGGQMPPGISLDAGSGLIRGTPAQAGRFEFRIAVTDGTGDSYSKPFTIEVKKMALVYRWLPDAITGQPYSFDLKVLGGRPPYKLAANPPAGLRLDPETGRLSGVPTGPSTSTFAVNITDGQGTYEADRLYLKVRGTTILISHFLADAKRDSPYRKRFEAVGNTSPLKWDVSPTEVSKIGLNIDPLTGEFSGTPTKTGTFSFSVSARGGESQTRRFSLTVLP